MKVTREQFAENRERILHEACALFRQHGFDGVGIADIMSAAGLTHGGFYRHFASKDDLVAQASQRAMNRSVARWEEIMQAAPQEELPALLKHYLSEAQRDAAGHGCMFAALGSDAARQDKSVRAKLTGGLRSMLDLIAGALPGRGKAARRRRAISVMSEMVGAAILARIVDDPAFAKEILAAAGQNLAAVAQEPQAA